MSKYTTTSCTLYLNIVLVRLLRIKNQMDGGEAITNGVVERFWCICLIGSLASVTDGSWPYVIGLDCQCMFKNRC